MDYLYETFAIALGLAAISTMPTGIPNLRCHGGVQTAAVRRRIVVLHPTYAVRQRRAESAGGYVGHRIVDRNQLRLVGDRPRH